MCVCGGGGGGGGCCLKSFFFCLFSEVFFSTDLHVCVSVFYRTPFFFCECKTLITV